MRRPPLHLWASLYLEAAMLAIEAQQVIALRTMRLCLGGAPATAEAWRMMSEKAFAAATAGLGVSAGLATGRSDTAIARGAVRQYRRKVGANRRRLLK